MFGVHREHGWRALCQCKDWRVDEITPADLWRLIALSYTVEAHPVLVTTAGLSRRAKQIARRWEVRLLRPRDLEEQSTMPIPGERLGLPRERRWSSRLADDGEMRELLLRGGILPSRESRPSY
ncbi:hypothetical protein BDK61_1460 [Haloarcula quadrata]|uniref:Restriction endonuclease n=1 Tax=Haloarcula quadrata TaxID=182779 RepID=A0A495R4B3_9EURY|nr:hypothetical protein [Haloarcula quadrata]RKS82161.1 hypothetical protein BDK61_1460 [Haloarcula quadrata]